MVRCVVRSLALGLPLLPLLAEPAAAWFFDPPPPAPQPPPIHVYDYTRQPVWTPNGWAHVPVEVHFPRTAPTLIVPPQNVEPLPERRHRSAKVRKAHKKRASIGPYDPMPLPMLPPPRRGTLR